MRIILAVVFVFATWRWAEWRNWQKYHATILYFVLIDLIYNFLTYNHPMWEYSPNHWILSNHTIATLVDEFISFPCTVLLYLSNFPKKRLKQGLYILMWVGIYAFIEIIAVRLQLISYHNGWAYWHSILLDIVTFIMLRVHYKKPLLAYGLSLIIGVFLVVLFKVPINSMK